ncbi:hypothetical protein RLEG12_31910 [Rhizobium leguminosarum bv. trifolii CB782]|nr:hypothetical protein RLEG12_31910 [Rhizobium leguminosarum bv. trifolii CB782]
MRKRGAGHRPADVARRELTESVADLAISEKPDYMALKFLIA